MTTSDVFSNDKLERLAGGSWIRRVEFHRELASTNDRGLQLAADASLVTPLLVLAERQTAGRGRGTNRWWSDAGGLTFSLVLDRQDREPGPGSWTRLALAVAVGVCDWIDARIPAAGTGIKWPNDVCLKGRKVCGVLVETASAAPDRFIVGVGINVNNRLDAAPPDVRAGATSLRDATGQVIEPIEVLFGVLGQIDGALALLTSDEAQLMARLRSRCVLTGQIVAVEAGAQRVIGTCRGIEDDGALLLETARGIRRYVSGSVTRVEASGASAGYPMR